MQALSALYCALFQGIPQPGRRVRRVVFQARFQLSVSLFYQFSIFSAPFPLSVTAYRFFSRALAFSYYRAFIRAASQKRAPQHPVQFPRVRGKCQFLAFIPKYCPAP